MRQQADQGMETELLRAGKGERAKEKNGTK